MLFPLFLVIFAIVIFFTVSPIVITKNLSWKIVKVVKIEEKQKKLDYNIAAWEL